MFSTNMIRNKNDENVSPPVAISSAMYPITMRAIPDTLIERKVIKQTVNPLTILDRFLCTNKVIDIINNAMIKAMKINLRKS